MLRTFNTTGRIIVQSIQTPGFTLKFIAIACCQWLKGLINQSPVMLFMKGDATTPRCGFSKTTIGILQESGVPFSTFDILSDDDVRQGLKKFSDWPTYPQLYVKGELVGGLDIIKELKDTGDLASTLKGSN